MFTGVTLASIIGDATTVAAEFASPITIALGVSFAVFAVGYGVRLIAKRGK